MTAHGVRCKKYGEVIALKLDGAECLCGDRCAVFPERAIPSDLPTIVYRTNVTVHAHVATDHSQATVQILTDEDMRDVQSFSFRPEFADQICAAIKQAASFASAGQQMTPIKFVTDHGTN